MEEGESDCNVYIPSHPDEDNHNDVSDKVKVNSKTDAEKASGDAKLSQHDDLPVLECPVCLQPCVHPVQLPCSHIFCFLCVKGVANRSKRCALCRQEIPLAFFHNPKLICQEELVKTAAFEDGYQWFYEGRNGWWQYDERTSSDLEDKYKAGEKSFELLIAGFLYVIDLDSMLQYRRNDPTRRRRIKRDLENIPEKKGVAGLRTASNPNARQGAYGVETTTGGKGQPSQAGDGQNDGAGRPGMAHVTLLTPQDSQSPATSGLSAPDLSSMMEDLHIGHLGDGQSTSPDQPAIIVQGRPLAPSQTNNLQRGLRNLSSSPTFPKRSGVATSQRAGPSGHSESSQVSSHSKQPGRVGAEGSSSTAVVTNAGIQPVRRIHSSSSISSTLPQWAPTHRDLDVSPTINERRSRRPERQKSPHEKSS